MLSDVAGTSFTWTAAIQTTPAGGTISGHSDCASSCGTAIAQSLTNTGTTAGVIRYTITPVAVGCTGESFTVDATVNPVPVVDQPASQVKCNGTLTDAINFSGAGATSFSWTNDNTSIGLAASGTGNISAFTATNNGSAKVTANIIVTPHFTGGGITCDGSTKSFTIIVNPTPIVDQPGNQEICKGTSTTAINFTGAGATSFSWTNDNTSIGLAASGTGNIAAFNGVTGNTTSIATITVTPHFTGDGLTCDGLAKTFTITVNPDAAPPAVTYLPPSCTETTFSVQVDNPEVGSTYKLTQLDGNIVNLGPYVSGDLIFTGLHIGQGYSIVSTTASGCKSNPNECPVINSLISTKSNEPSIALREQVVEKPKVVAAPNPFNDRIRFSVISPVAGQGSLELYNTLGQNVKVIYQGYIEKGVVQNFEYNVPGAQRSNLIYLFRIGNHKISGTLIGIK